MMKKVNHVFIGIHIKNRTKNAKRIQDILTKFGCGIRTRLGLHDATDDFCSPSGIILLEMCGPADDIKVMEKMLRNVPGVDLKKMVFGH